jgi:hypothetical protein
VNDRFSETEVKPEDEDVLSSETEVETEDVDVHITGRSSQAEKQNPRMPMLGRWMQSNQSARLLDHRKKRLKLSMQVLDYRRKRLNQRMPLLDY